MSNLSEKPIIKQFCAAAKLVNEWRDTLSYAAFVAGASWGMLNHPDFPVGIYISCVSAREGFRSACWGNPFVPLIAGAGGPEIDRRKFFAAAGSVQFATFVPAIALSSFPQSLKFVCCLLGGALSISYFRRVGGVKGVLESYQTMWDWPRKRGGGGTTQTQKLKDGFKALAGRVAKAVSGLAPQPVSQLSRVSIPAACKQG